MNDSTSTEVVSEIIEAEKRRAEKMALTPLLSEWVTAFRHKYIANGFLTPFYVWDGRYSRPRQRIEHFGDFILPYEMAGTVFHQGAAHGWIHQESMWFWEYLVSGQEIIFSRPLSALPDAIMIDGAPADTVWRELVQITTRLGFFGEDGGGILLSPRDLDVDHQTKMSDNKGWLEGEDGYLEPYPRPGQPRWIELFQHYEQLEYSKINLEIRPAWFHLANFAFFNAPIGRLSVFCGTFNTQRQIEGVRFLDDNTSDQARAFIGKELLGMPIVLREQLSGDALKRERQEMIWWLWHNVGHKEQKKTLSYGEIADIAGTKRSSVQTTVERFNKRLRKQLDSKLLGRLLLTGGRLGLGYNLIHNTLVKQGLAPAREREIDGFDKLDKLI